MSDRYGFTTDREDNYFTRVVAEANPDTNFIIVTERDTIAGPVLQAAVLVRKVVLVLGLVLPELPLAGKTLGDWLTDAVKTDLPVILDGGEVNPWTYALIQSDNQEAVDEELERIRNEVRRIENIVDGKTVRVTVESF